MGAVIGCLLGVTERYLLGEEEGCVVGEIEG